MNSNKKMTNNSKTIDNQVLNIVNEKNSVRHSFVNDATEKQDSSLNKKHNFIAETVN